MRPHVLLSVNSSVHHTHKQTYIHTHIHTGGTAHVVLSMRSGDFDHDQLHQVFARIRSLKQQSQVPGHAHVRHIQQNQDGSLVENRRRLMSSGSVDMADGTNNFGQVKGTNDKKELVEARSLLLNAALRMVREGESVLFDVWVRLCCVCINTFCMCV